MSLEPFFSLSPLSPRAYTYDASNSAAPYASASLYSYGGVVRPFPGQSLEDQYNNNQILLGFDPAPDTEQTITSYTNDLYRRSAISLLFYGKNVSTVNQYLLVFRLAHKWGSPIAQFFLGTSLVRDEALTQSPYDDIAILLDTPGDGVSLWIHVRLAASDSSYVHGFYCNGVDCYLL